MIRRLIILLLIVGCATKSVSSSKPTEYSMGMGIEEFKEKNEGLELFEQKKMILFILEKNVLNVIRNTIYLLMES